MQSVTHYLPSNAYSCIWDRVCAQSRQTLSIGQWRSWEGGVANFPGEMACLCGITLHIFTLSVIRRDFFEVRHVRLAFIALPGSSHRMLSILSLCAGLAAAHDPAACALVSSECNCAGLPIEFQSVDVP